MSDGRARRSKRVGFISLGCAKNLVDTEVMLGHLDGSGWDLVKDPAEADVIIVNTCSFIGPARKESIDTILEAAEYKKTGRLRRLVVAGCMVQRYEDELQSSLPEIDAFIDLDELHAVTDRLEDRPSDKNAAPLRSDLPLTAARPTTDPDRPAVRWSAARYLYDETTPRRLATPPWTAYVKIAEGCNHTCSFCAIPGFRGRFRSRTPDSVVDEVQRLVRGGVREVNLIAQDSSHYGRDLGLDEGPAKLLGRLDEVEGLRWIRLHYLYPNTITDLLIETMARRERVVEYVDLPLQHADRDVLRRMRRGGSAVGHLRLLEKFRRAMPAVALRSTFIVGFPGETDAEFERLLEFVREVRFDHLGVFTYSHEEGTTAFELEDDVPAELKQERFGRLMECQQAIVAEHNAAMVGRRVEVLVEGAHPETEHLLVGRMSRQAPDVDGQVLINDGTARPGEFVPVRLSETAGYDLVGAILDAA